jgi:hypothetical protein
VERTGLPNFAHLIAQNGTELKAKHSRDHLDEEVATPHFLKERFIKGTRIRKIKWKENLRGRFIRDTVAKLSKPPKVDTVEVHHDWDPRSEELVRLRAVELSDHIDELLWHRGDLLLEEAARGLADEVFVFLALLRKLLLFFRSYI